MVTREENAVAQNLNVSTCLNKIDMKLFRGFQKVWRVQQPQPFLVR